MDTDYDGFITTSIDSVVNWSRKFSLFQYPFVTACCGMEYMAAACSHYDISRFGAEIPRFSPRQADLLWVVGTITHKMSPVLKTIYDQMADPKWVIAFGTCASTGGFYQKYQCCHVKLYIITMSFHSVSQKTRFEWNFLYFSSQFRPQKKAYTAEYTSQDNAQNYHNQYRQVTRHN